MNYTGFLDLLGIENLKNPTFIAKVHSYISHYQESKSNKKELCVSVQSPLPFNNVDASNFFILYGSLVDEAISFKIPEKEGLKYKALQLLKWSLADSHWNDIFISKVVDSDPSKLNSIISESKFDILKYLHFPYSIALALKIDEIATTECIVEPILTSFHYNFENSISKLSSFSKIENAFTFIKLQLDLCVSALDKSWISLEENRELLKNSLKIANSGQIIDKLLDWKPVEAVGLVLAKYFRKFVLRRLSYFAYDYLDISMDSPVKIEQLIGDVDFGDVYCAGVTKNHEYIKVCKTVIGSLFNLAIKWVLIDRNSAMELLKDEPIPSLLESGSDHINLIELWQTLNAEAIENIIPMVFDTHLIHILEEIVSVTSKHVDVLAQPQSYVESTIGVFIKKTLELVKNKWNEIDNIFDSIETSSEYLNIISEIISVCEKSEIKSLIQLEEAYIMRDKMQDIFVICFDEYMQAKLKYILNRVITLSVLEEKVQLLLKHTKPLSYVEIFTQLANNIQKTIIDYVIPSDNLMIIKNEYHLKLLCENLREIRYVMPVQLPYISELLYIFENCQGKIDPSYFTALSNEQVNQAIQQALHAKLKFQDFTLNPKLSI